MELTQLNQFKVIAELGKISAASEVLYVSSPALSKSVKKLEDELGVKLFERTHNTLTLNAAGKIVLDNANLIFSVIKKMEYELNENIKNNNHELRFASSLPASLHYILPLFSVARQDVTVSSELIHQTKLKNVLMKDTADIVISSEKLNDPAIENLPLCEERLMIYAPKSSPLAQKKRLYVTDLAGETIIRFNNEADTISHRFEELAKKNNVNLDYIYQTSYPVYQSMMKTDNCLYFSSNISRRYNAEVTNRIHIPFAEKELRITYYVSFLRKNGALVAPFREWLREHYRDIIA